MVFNTHERDELTPSEPSVSPLYPIEPLGLGTPKVECLTSYLSRLAQAHNVKTATLIKSEILPHIREAPQRLHTLRVHAMTYSGTLNHCGQPAVDMIQALEQLTWREDLHFMTLVPWKDTIGTLKVMRSHRAWCPECYSELVDIGRDPYDQLLWTLNVVKTCPYHGVALLDSCTNCHERVPFLGPIGVCPKCLMPLSSTDAHSNGTPDEIQVEISHQIGQLLAFISTPSPLPSRQTINVTLNRCVAVHFNGSSKLFSQCLGLSQSYGNNLLHDYNPVSISTLATLSLQTGVSILDLIHNKFGHHSQVLPRKQYGVGYYSELTQTVLSDHLQPKSISQFIRKAGIGRKAFNKHLPEISTQFNAWKKRVNPYRFGAPIVIKHQKIPNSKLTRIRTELEQIIERQEGQSLPQIALRLNCRFPSIKWHFPHHYKELRQQHRDNKGRVKQRITAHLQTVLESNGPTPKLTEIARHLDVDVNTLRYYDENLCKQIVQKRKSQNHEDMVGLSTTIVAASKESLQNALEFALLEYPPPSLSEVQRRIGILDSSIREMFPELSKKISQRSKDYISYQRNFRCTEIRDTAIDLHAKGVYPNMTVIWQTLGYRINTPERRQAWFEILRELGYNRPS